MTIAGSGAWMKEGAAPAIMSVMCRLSRLRRLALLLAAGGSTLAADPIEQALNRLYNFDFPGSHALLDSQIASRPDEAAPYAVRSAVYLFFELDRLGILEAEFFTDDERITNKKKIQPDPEVKRRFLKAVDDAQSRARATLASRPDDRNAWFAKCVSLGVLVDYTALVEKRHMGSLSVAKRSNECAQRLLRLDPQSYDAHVTTGFSEYLLGSLPFLVRWVVRFENVQGSKQKAIENLRLAATSGRYFKAFAKILLSIVYLREKQPRESERLLGELAREYPENPLIRKEWARLSARLGTGPVEQK